MNPFARLSKARRRRLGGRRGNIVVIAAVAFLPVIGAVGLGVDYTRLSLVKAELQRGADAAALAGARIINADGTNRAEVVDDAHMYFWANYRKSLAHAEIVGGDPAVTIVEPNRDTVTVVADARVPLAFGSVLGFGSRPLQVTASAQRAVGGMEVVLVLDNTGSMARGTRLADLKSGARDLVEILYGGNDTKELRVCPPGNAMGGCTTDYLLTVGMVPFITTVNVSAGRGDGTEGSFVDPSAISRHAWGANSWKGCVLARPYPFEESRADALPTESPFAPYYWAPGSWSNPWTIAATAETWPDKAAPSGLEAMNRAKVGAGAGREAGPNMGCGQPLMPLQPAKSAVLEQIDGLEVGAGNGTIVPIGLAWGWRVLSPDWRPYWSGRTTTLFPKGNRVDVTTPAAVPRDYGTRNYEKVVVLFTDGENVVHANTAADACCMGGYGDPAVVRATLGTTPVVETNRRTLELCTAVKAKGIRLYVVLLYPNPPQALLDLYNEKGCASGRNSFFHASSEAQLRGIFSTVGSQLKNLRLVR